MYRPTRSTSLLLVGFSAILIYPSILQAGNTLASGGPGRMAVDPLVGLVDPDQGSVLESVVDFAMPSKGASAVQWRHMRTFDHRSGGPGDTVQGQNWFHHYLQTLTLEAGGEDDDDKDVTWRADAHHSYVFSNSGNYTFAANDRTFAVLSHDHVGDPGNTTFRLEFLDGTIMVFNDNSVGDPLKLKYIEDVYGNKLSITYASGKIDYITDPSGHYFRYSYLTSGDNNGKLSQIVVWKDSSTNDNNEKIATIDFTYKANSDGNDSGCGIIGDLIKVVVTTRATTDTTSLSIARTTHYRYFSGAYNSDTNPGHDHEMRMILRPEHYQRADEDAGFGAPPTATNAQVDDYATYQFEYDSSNRCRKMTMAMGGSGGCCGGGGGGDPGAYDFTYDASGTTGRNSWKVRCKVVHNGWTRYFDLNNWGEVCVDVLFTTDDSNSDPLWAEQYERESGGGTYGRVLTHYSPASITDYDVSGHSLTYNNDGKVMDYTYDSNSKQTASMRVRKKNDSGGSAKYMGLWEYTAAPAGFTYRARYLLDKSYEYPAETTTSTDSSRLTTDYDYFYHADSGDADGDSNTSEDTDRVKVVKVTLPTVTTAQNGPNVAATRFTYFDTVGWARWMKDEEGHVQYQSFHELTGAQTYTVQDVFTDDTEGEIEPTGITSPDTDGGENVWADWTGAAPKDSGGSPAWDFQVTGSSGSCCKVESKRLMDLSGRLRRTTDGGGMLTYHAYLDAQSRTYVAWNSSTDKPLFPIRVVLTDKDGHTEEIREVDPTSITISNDPPTGSEDVTDQTKWVSWTRTTYDSNLRTATVNAYHVIPSSGNGSVGTNYYTTTYTYAANSGTKTTTVQVEDPENGYTKTTSNPRGQSIKVEGTATEDTGSPTAWKTLTEYFYDQATPGSGSSKGGNGNLTQVKSYYGDSSSESVCPSYDWRDRRVLTCPPAAPYTLTKFDNMNRLVAVGTYSAAPSSSADPTSTSTNRLSLSETLFNNRGNVYRSKQHEVLSDGTLDSYLTTDTYYDREGRTVAVKSPGAGIQVTKYDGAGRAVQTQACTSLGSTLYDGNSAFDYTNDNKIVELTTTGYDSASRVTEVLRYELKAAATSTQNPSSPGTDSQCLILRHYYDAANRQNQVTDMGTHAGANGPMGGSPVFFSAYSSGSPESRTDTKLVTTWTYGADGRLSKVTDPGSDADSNGYETNYEYDDLGRRTAVIENADSGGLARRTEYQYNGNSNLTKLIARDVDEYGYDGGDALEDQVTQYVYGQAVNSGWVTEIRYPGSNGQASSSSADKVVFTYNHDGTIATRTDQNGSVMTYEYDTLRRVTQERVTTTGSGVDGAILRIATTYDNNGRVQFKTSYNNATVGSGTVLNEVKHTYNGLSQLTKDEQEAGGSVGGGTPSVQYTYTESTANNHSRLDYFTYPNGRNIYTRYTYDDGTTDTWQEETNDAFSRVGQLSRTSSSDIYVEYTFAGLSRMIKREAANGSGEVGNDSLLNRDTGTADQYAALDQFGRVVEQKVTNSAGSTTRTDVDYRSHRDGSPKFAEEQANVLLGRAGLYTYDGLHRLSQADFGRLDSGRTDIQTEWSDPQQEVYTMDILGNFSAIDHKNGGTSASETRVHNATNELTSRTITAHAPVYWVNDPFTDNNTNQWSVADLISGGGDGTWSAASAKLQNDTVVAVTNAPGGNGSMILADVGTHQDFMVSGSVTLTSGAIGGLVFGLTDVYNFWLFLANSSATRYELYEVTGNAGSGRTFTLRGNTSNSTVSSGGGTFSLAAEVYSGWVTCTSASSPLNYAATIPPGLIGAWAGTGSQAVKFDDFKVRDRGLTLDVDGVWSSIGGGVSVTGGNLRFAADSLPNKTAIRRGFRGSTYILEYNTPVTHPNIFGSILHYQDPENYMAAVIARAGGNGTVHLYRRLAGQLSTLASDLFVTSAGDTVKCVITESGGNQTLTVYVAGTSRLSTGTIDDNWKAGMVGFFDPKGTAQHEVDALKLGYDNNADADIADAGDDIQFDDSFGSTTITLTYDNNGNLTDDGIYLFKYDAWNRLVGATRRLDAYTAVAAYEFDGFHRRLAKVVTNCGFEMVIGVGGNATVRYFYDNQWRMIEARNGSNSATHQWLWGTQYIDELVWMDANLDGVDDCDPDVTTGEEGEVSGVDTRYFYHQDRNWNVVALTAYGDGVNGQIVERYTYTPYGELRVLAGNASGVELARPGGISSVGNPFAHQGLPFDVEKRSYQNRFREYVAGLQRFGQRDLIEYVDSLSLFSYEVSRPTSNLDSLGLLCPNGGWNCQAEPGEPGQPPGPQPRPQPLPTPCPPGSLPVRICIPPYSCFVVCLGPPPPPSPRIVPRPRPDPVGPPTPPPPVQPPAPPGPDCGRPRMGTQHNFNSLADCLADTTSCPGDEMFCFQNQNGQVWGNCANCSGGNQKCVPKSCKRSKTMRQNGTLKEHWCECQ